MNRRTLVALALILVLCGVTAVAGGRRLGQAPRAEIRLEAGAPDITPASATPRKWPDPVAHAIAD
jgi:hypothetical protein